MVNEEQAREERAMRLREQIARLAQGKTEAAPAKQDSKKKPERPRDFVHRRMQELDQGAEDA